MATSTSSSAPSLTCGDRITPGPGFGCVALIAFVPYLTLHDRAGALAALPSELHPFPPR
jgi:hypothetical protein